MEARGEPRRALGRSPGSLGSARNRLPAARCAGSCRTKAARDGRALVLACPPGLAMNASWCIGAPAGGPELARARALRARGGGSSSRRRESNALPQAASAPMRALPPGRGRRSARSSSGAPEFPDSGRGPVGAGRRAHGRGGSQSTNGSSRASILRQHRLQVRALGDSPFARLRDEAGLLVA
jgi:hypothetical protein